jgi:hypothetical protein
MTAQIQHGFTIEDFANKLLLRPCLGKLDLTRSVKPLMTFQNLLVKILKTKSKSIIVGLIEVFATERWAVLRTQSRISNGL